MTLRFTVTLKHCIDGRPGDGCRCAVALAVWETTGSPCNVDGDAVQVGNHDEDRYEVTAELGNWIDYFDHTRWGKDLDGADGASAVLYGPIHLTRQPDGDWGRTFELAPCEPEDQDPTPFDAWDQP